MASAARGYSMYPNEDPYPPELRSQEGSRPKSKAKRPNSANSTKTKNYDKGLKVAAQVYNSNVPNFAPTKGGDDEDNYYTNMPREELISSLLEAKRKIKKYDTGVAQLRAENQRWEQEVTKQQRRIEALLNPASAVNRNGQASADTRKEIEKTIIVRQLKTQIMLLRGTFAEKEAEVEALKKSQKSTHIVELVSEKEEYYLETLRLKQLVRELRETLQSERQRRDWDRRMAGGKDAPRIITGGGGNSAPNSEMSPNSMPVRPYIVPGAAAAAAGPSAANGKPSRPSSAGVNKKVSIKPPIPLSAAVQVQDPVPPKKSRPSSASSNKRRENRLFHANEADALEDIVDNPNRDAGKVAAFSSKAAAAGAVAAVAAQKGKHQKGGGGSSKAAAPEVVRDRGTRGARVNNTRGKSAAAQPSSASTGTGVADDILLDSSDTFPLDHMSSAAGGSGQRPTTAAAGAKQRSSNPFAPRSGRGSAAGLSAEYDESEYDGPGSLLGQPSPARSSSGVSAPASEPAKLTSSGSASKLIAEIPAFKGQNSSSSPSRDRDQNAYGGNESEDIRSPQQQRKPLIIEKGGSGGGWQAKMLAGMFKSRSQTLRDAELAESVPFKAGDRVDGQFRNGTSWYPAIVKAVNVPVPEDGSSGTLTFHLIYDDGDEEKTVPVERIRLVESATATATPATAQASKSSVNNSKQTAAAATSSSSATTPARDNRDRQNMSVSVNSRSETPKIVESPAKAVPAAAAADLSSDIALPSKREKGQQGHSSSATSSSVAGKPPAAITGKGAAAGVAKKIRFKVGDAVEGQFEGGTDWYSAKIAAVNARGYYDLAYDDGDDEYNVPPERVRLLFGGGDDSSEAVLNNAVKAGVAAAASAHRDDDQKYNQNDEKEEGNAEDEKDRDEENITSKKSSKSKVDSSQGGRAQNKMRGEERKEEEEEEDKKEEQQQEEVGYNGKYDVGEGKDDADAKADESKQQQTALEGKPSQQKQEDNVICPDCSYPNYYRAYRCEMCNYLLDSDTEQQQQQGDEKWAGDKDTNSDRRTDDKLSDDIGDVAPSSSSSSGKKKKKSNDDGIVDDGDADGPAAAAVAVKKGAATATATAPSSSSSSKANKKAAAGGLRVGARVEGNYFGEGKWFPGKITKDHGDTTYDVIYDDGDEETQVPETHIRLLEEERPPVVVDSSEPAPAEQEKGGEEDEEEGEHRKRGGPTTMSESQPTEKINKKDPESEVEADKKSKKAPQPETGCRYYLGEEIESRYGGGVKYYPGTIAKSYPPKKGTSVEAAYDILYSDGDNEKSVSEEMLKRRGEVDPPKKPQSVLSDADSGETGSSRGQKPHTTSIPEGVKASDPSFLDRFLDDLSDDDDNGDLTAGPAIYGNTGIGGIAEGVLNDGPTYGGGGGMDGDSRGGRDTSAAEYEDDFDA